MTENEVSHNGNGGDTDETGNGMSDRSTHDYGLTTPVTLEGGMPATLGNDMENVPVPPIVPRGGAPVFPGNDGADIPVPPIAPEGGRPVFPDPDSTPAPPVAPEGGRPVASSPGVNIPGFSLFSSFPIVPSYPSPQHFGQVRFLNASTNSFPADISVNNTTYVMSSRFGTVSNYGWVADGFYITTVRGATDLRSILFQQTFPFMTGVKTTMVLTDTPSGGLSMVKVTNTGCTNLPFSAGCYRFANMTYSGSNSDLLLYGDETVFRNVGFREVAFYKQAMADSYQFYMTNSSNFSVIREIPVIVTGAYTNGNIVNEPLSSLQVDIATNRNYTTYMIGNTWPDSGLRALTVED